MPELLTQPITPEGPAQLAGIKSEWWPASNRNGGRHQIGIPGRLPSESTYYLNRFHSGGVGTIVLTLLPAQNGNPISITVKRDAAGNRSVNATNGADGKAILAELNREFVLLDGGTFHNFIDFMPQARGRSFAGLLGLKQYSVLRQGLSTLANTRSFTNHFGMTDKQNR